MHELARGSRLAGWFALGRLANYRLVPTILACILLVAAFLKGHELATEELSGKSLLTSRWFLTCLVLFELALGLSLLSGLHARLIRVAALLTLIVFFEVALYQGITGQPSCRCLGKASVNPWFMVTFDVLALAGIFAWQPSSIGPALVSHRGRFATVAIGYAVAAIPMLVSMVNYTPTGQMPLLRNDPQLAARMKVQLKNANAEQLLAHLHAATGLSFTAEDKLTTGRPVNFGEIYTSSARAWSIMEMLAQRQTIPARWKKVEGGYELVQSAPLGRLTPWLVSGFILFGAAIGLTLYPAKSRDFGGTVP